MNQGILKGHALIDTYVFAYIPRVIIIEGKLHQYSATHSAPAHLSVSGLSFVQLKGVKMKTSTALSIIGVLLLSGCTTVGQKQAECEKTNTAFAEIVACTKQAFADNPQAQMHSGYKLYILKGEQLVQKVQRGEITELDAKVEWQNLYHQLKSKEVKEQNAAVSSAINSYNANRPRTTTCSESYGSATCTTY